MSNPQSEAVQSNQRTPGIGGPIGPAPPSEAHHADERKRQLPYGFGKSRCRHRSHGAWEQYRDLDQRRSLSATRQHWVVEIRGDWGWYVFDALAEPGRIFKGARPVSTAHDGMRNISNVLERKPAIARAGLA